MVMRREPATKKCFVIFKYCIWVMKLKSMTIFPPLLQRYKRMTVEIFNHSAPTVVNTTLCIRSFFW